MSNLDLINAYFGNEMTDVEKQEFESKLQNDTELKKEFDFQKEVVDAIKEARRADLKSMLNKVPVGGGSSGAVTLGKVISAVTVVGIITLGVYYLWPDEPQKDIVKQDEVSMVAPSENKEVEKTEPEASPATPAPEEEKVVESKKPAENNTAGETIERQPETATEKTTSEPEISKPDLVPAFDTQEDANDSLEAPGGNMVAKSGEDYSTLDVEVDNTNKNFTFHYQFKSGKLFLYGSFDKGLYEILEINSHGTKTLFLYYKDKFYPLRTDQVKIVPLEPVKEPSLIEKLKKARGEG